MRLTSNSELPNFVIFTVQDVQKGVSNALKMEELYLKMATDRNVSGWEVLCRLVVHLGNLSLSMNVLL